MPTLTISQPKANQVVAVAHRFQVSGRATDSAGQKVIKIVVTVQVDNGPPIKAQLKSIPDPRLTIVDFSATPAVLGEGPHIVTVNATFGQSAKLTKPVKVKGVRNLPAGEAVDAFWMGSDNDLWEYSFTGGAWTGPQSFGAGPLGGPPKVTSPSLGASDVFWKGTDGNLWHKGYDPAAGWGAIQNLGCGPLGSDPCPTSPGGGVIEVFWRGTDNQLWHTRYEAGVWSGPLALGGQLSSGGLGHGDGLPRVISPGAGVVEAFWGHDSGIMWHNRFTPGTGWSGPGQLAPYGNSYALMDSDPYPIALGGGVIDVFFQGIDAAQCLYYITYVPGVGWNADGPRQLMVSQQILANPHPATPGAGIVDVFWKNASGELVHLQFDGANWWPGPQKTGASGLIDDPDPIGAGTGSVIVVWGGNGSNQMGIQWLTYPPLVPGVAPPQSLPIGSVAMASDPDPVMT